ncbi:hypothetical protein F5877DRAFT_9859, partial [Lentinula edodes]
SARFGFGLYPQYLTSYFGPIQVRLASEQPSQSTIEVHVRLLTTPNVTDEPVAAMVNCFTLSLLNAGSVPMRGVICAVSVARFSPVKGEIPIYEVQSTEEPISRLETTGCFAFLFSDSV